MKRSIFYMTAICFLLIASIPQESAGQTDRHPIFDAVDMAVHKGDLKKLEALIAADPKAVNAVLENGFTPLHELAVVMFAPTGGAFTDPDATKVVIRRDVTAAEVAVAAVLISKGVDINARDKEGSTALHYALSNRKFSLSQFLVNKGADVNAVVRSGWEGATPLHFAAAYGQLSLVKLMLSRGANPAAKTKKGQTPADLAGENKEILSLLKAAATKR